MPEALNLPAAMVQAAAEELFGWLKDDEWPADSTRERALDCARDVLTAALAACEVREEWGVRNTWPNGDVADYMRGPRYMADATVYAQQRAGVITDRVLIRQLVITTPPEEVPDAP